MARRDWHLSWRPTPGQPYPPGANVDGVMADLRFEQRLQQLYDRTQARRHLGQHITHHPHEVIETG